MKRKKVNRTHNMNAGHSAVVKQPKVAPVARRKIINAGRNRSRQDWPILGYERNVGRNKSNVCITDNFRVRNKTFESQTMSGNPGDHEQPQ